jgi:hypothetical protein
MPLPQKLPNSTAPRDAGIVILGAVIVFVISHYFDLIFRQKFYDYGGFGKELAAKSE